MRAFGWKKLLIALTLLVTAKVGYTFLPEPDAVIYGWAYHRFNEPLKPSYEDRISVVAVTDAGVFSSATLSKNTNYFLLRIPMSAGEPRLPGTIIPGEEVRIFISNAVTGRIYDCGVVQIPNERGPALRSDLTTEASVSGSPADFNGDGIPDYWVVHYGFAPNEDISTKDDDGDGMNNYAEWVCGTNPRDPTSRLTVYPALVIKPNPQVVIKINPTRTDKVYKILTSQNLGGPWHEVRRLSPLQNGALEVTFSIQTNGPIQFFRIAIE